MNVRVDETRHDDVGGSVDHLADRAGGAHARRDAFDDLCARDHDPVRRVIGKDRLG